MLTYPSDGTEDFVCPEIRLLIWRKGIKVNQIDVWGEFHGPEISLLFV